MIFKSDGPNTDLDGFLDAGSHVEGDLRFENTFRIYGQLTGKIVSDGTLVVGEGGRVVGEVSAGQVFVSGRVEGSIRAQKRVQISGTGKVQADLETPTLVIEDGALFEGRCFMAGRPESQAGRQGPQPLQAPVPFSKDR
jgi:cytoskeletal protein CcmA (bactofilin family)